MAVQNVRLTVRDPNGTLRHERYLEHATVAMRMDVPASGWEIGRTGYGGCLEATWQGRQQTLDVRERDIIEIDVQDGGAWTREYAGVMVKTGNGLSDRHSNFKAAGLKKRLTEVRVVADVPEGDVGAQVRSALSAVITSGQLGSAVVYNAALIPDLGSVQGAVPARGRSLADLLNYLAGQAGAVWDVNADRELFLRAAAPAPADTLALTEGADVYLGDLLDTDSEALVTCVRFLVPGRDGGILELDVTLPEAAQFGTAWKDVPLDGAALPQLFEELPPLLIRAHKDRADYPTEVQYRPDWRDDGSPRPPDGSSPPRPEYLTDGLNSTTVAHANYIADPPDPGLNGPASIRLGVRWAAPVEAVRIRSLSTYDTMYYAGDTLTAPWDGSRTVITAHAPGQPGAEFETMTNSYYVNSSYLALPAGTTEFYAESPARYDSLTGQNNATAGYRELVGLRRRTDRLETLARFHAVLPQRDPASVTVWGRVTPRPKLVLTREDSSVYERPIEKMTLHVKLAEDLRVVVQAGQREPAEERAQRWLGQVALEDATVTAVRFGT